MSREVAYQLKTAGVQGGRCFLRSGGAREEGMQQSALFCWQKEGPFLERVFVGARSITPPGHHPDRPNGTVLSV